MYVVLPIKFELRIRIHYFLLIQKETHIVQEPLITSAWSGQTFRNQEDERLVHADNMMITSARGTSRLKI